MEGFPFDCLTCGVVWIDAMLIQTITPPDDEPFAIGRCMCGDLCRWSGLDDEDLAELADEMVLEAPGVSPIAMTALIAWTVDVAEGDPDRPAMDAARDLQARFELELEAMVAEYPV